MASAKKSFWGKIVSFIKWVLTLFFSSSILAVVLYRFVPVPVTPLMVIRCVQQVKSGKTMTLHHSWTPLEQMSPHMPVAAMASCEPTYITG